MKQPTKLTLEQMFEEMNHHNDPLGSFYYKNGLAIALNLSRLFRPFLSSGQAPYILDDYRIGIVRKGYMRSIINLKEYNYTAGMAVFITPGTIVEPLEMSDDFQVMGMGIPADLFQIIHSGKVPDIFSAKMRNGFHVLSTSERQLSEHMFYTLWEIANSQTTSESVTYHMIATIASYYHILFSKKTQERSYGNTFKHTFDRFLCLVNKHCCEQRKIAFYAEKMCLTERYLGTIVSHTSGQTAKEWIDKAVITTAKVRLRHSNDSIAVIAEELHFSTPSFFCKFFKRLAGCTPQQFRDA